MSELTSCNYCNLKRLERLAEERGQAIVMRAGPAGGMPYPAMIEVHLVDFDVEHGTVAEVAEDAKPASLMMAITTRCVC